MCEDIYIGNTHQTFKKRTNGHFSDLLCLLKKKSFKNGKSGSVYVTIYKTNPNQVTLIAKYKRWVSDHLLKVSNLTLHPKVIAVLDVANGLI